jgi:hypothetical protein
MKTIFARIIEKSAEFAERPMFTYLRDARLEPRRRLAFVPYLTHFVITFADLERRHRGRRASNGRCPEVRSTQVRSSLASRRPTTKRARLRRRCRWKLGELPTFPHSR